MLNKVKAKFQNIYCSSTKESRSCQLEFLSGWEIYKNYFCSNDLVFPYADGEIFSHSYNLFNHIYKLEYRRFYSLFNGKLFQNNGNTTSLYIIYNRGRKMPSYASST